MAARDGRLAGGGSLAGAEGREAGAGGWKRVLQQAADACMRAATRPSRGPPP